jgi:hypothetical protein
MSPGDPVFYFGQFTCKIFFFLNFRRTTSILSALPHTKDYCGFLLETIHLKGVTTFRRIYHEMASKTNPTSTEHEAQMALARAFQASRTPIKPPKQKNRGRGGPAHGAHGSQHKAMPSFGNHASASHGKQLASRRGTSTSIATNGNRGISSTARTSGGGGLSSSMWAPATAHGYAPPCLPCPCKCKYSFILCLSLTKPAAVPTTSPESTASDDRMKVDQPPTTAAPPSNAQPTATTSPVAPGSATAASLSKTYVAERSILDDKVPAVEGLDEPITPVKRQSMFPVGPGLSASRWAPRYTLDGRLIED